MCMLHELPENHIYDTGAMFLPRQVFAGKFSKILAEYADCVNMFVWCMLVGAAGQYARSGDC